MLTPTDLSRWDDDGYLTLNGFATDAECDELQARALELVDSIDPEAARSVFSARQHQRTDDYFLTSGDKIRGFFEEEALGPGGELLVPMRQAINKIGHALHDLDPVFERFCRSPRLARLATDLGVRDPLLVQSMMIFKQPGFGGEVGWHQDETFLYTEPPSTLGFWLALEEATLENGCLWVLAGMHRAGLRRRFVRDGGGTRTDTLDATPWPEDRAIPLPVPRGTLVVLNGLLPHKSDANRSAQSRHAFTLHVIEAGAHYPSDNWLQRSMPPRGF